MKIFMIILAVGLFTLPVFLISKYGVKKRESEEFVVAEKLSDEQH